MGTTGHDGSRRFGRRAMLHLAGGAAGGAILAACGETATPTVTAAPTAAARPTTGASAAPTTVPTTAPATAAATGASASGMATPTAAPTMATAASAASPTARSVGMMVATAAPMTEGFIPSPAPGVPDGWTKPPPAFKSVTAPVGRGGTFTSLMGTTASPIVPHDQNDYWKELEKRMNVRWDATLVPAGTFEEKFTALIASNSVPDIVNLSPPPPGFGRLVQQGAFTDLTPYVTGDALKEFPNLALYDPRIWKIALYAKKTMGVPRPRFFVANVLLFRQDWAEKVGFAQIKTADDLFNCFVAFTKMDPDGNGKADTFGLTTTSPRPNFAIPYFNGMYRGANNWRKNADGTLTKDIETEEYKQAVDFARRLWAAGAYHPDAATMTVNNAWDAYIGGKVGAYMDDQSSVGYGDKTRPAARLIAMSPGAKPVALAPFGFDGGKGTYPVNAGANSFAAMPARVGKDPERVKELLRVLNYLGAPFGSEEWRMLQYGIEGVHHTVRADGALVRNEKGEAEKNDLPNLTSGPRPFYYPDVPGPEPARFQQKVFQDHLAVGVEDPALGLNSPTLDMRGAELTTLQADRIVAVVTGREPLAAWDQFVKDWRSRGGDAIRNELQDALKG